MKRSKLFAITLQSKSGYIFFFILLAYNLLCGVYLKDFFELSPMLVTFYLLSALPTLFFVIKIRSNAMREIVCVVLFFVLGTSIISCYYCRRPLLMMVFFATAVELMYLAIFDNSSGKDKPLTKIYVLAVATLLLISLSEKLLAVVPGRHCAFRVFTFYAIIFVGLYGRIIFSLVNLLFGYSKV